MYPTFHIETHSDLNPLVGSNLHETACNCASALRWVCAIDVERLSDKAVEDGLYTIINPILAALECSADRESDCITLSAGDSKRLRALAEESHQGHIAEALNNAIDCAEITAEREAEERAAAAPEHRRRVWEGMRDMAERELNRLNGFHAYSVEQVGDRWRWLVKDPEGVEIESGICATWDEADSTGVAVQDRLNDMGENKEGAK